MASALWSGRVLAIRNRNSDMGVLTAASMMCCSMFQSRMSELGFFVGTYASIELAT